MEGFHIFWLGVYLLVEGLEYVGTLLVPRGSRSGRHAPESACQGRPSRMVFFLSWLGVYILVEGLEYVGTLLVLRGSISGVYALDFCFTG